MNIKKRFKLKADGWDDERKNYQLFKMALSHQFMLACKSAQKTMFDQLAEMDTFKKSNEQGKFSTYEDVKAAADFMGSLNGKPHMIYTPENGFQCLK